MSKPMDELETRISQMNDMAVNHGELNLDNLRRAQLEETQSMLLVKVPDGRGGAGSTDNSYMSIFQNSVQAGEKGANPGSDILIAQAPGDAVPKTGDRFDKNFSLDGPQRFIQQKVDDELTANPYPRDLPPEFKAAADEHKAYLESYLSGNTKEAERHLKAELSELEKFGDLTLGWQSMTLKTMGDLAMKEGRTEEARTDFLQGANRLSKFLEIGKQTGMLTEDQCKQQLESLEMGLRGRLVAVKALEDAHNEEQKMVAAWQHGNFKEAKEHREKMGALYNKYTTEHPTEEYVESGWRRNMAKRNKEIYFLLDRKEPYPKGGLASIPLPADGQSAAPTTPVAPNPVPQGKWEDRW